MDLITKHKVRSALMWLSLFVLIVGVPTGFYIMVKSCAGKLETAIVDDGKGKFKVGDTVTITILGCDGQVLGRIPVLDKYTVGYKDAEGEYHEHMFKEWQLK